MARNEHELSYLNDEDRLKAYQMITDGCSHLYSKGKPQEDKVNVAIDTFATLAEKDPIFLAHFTSYIIKNLDSKDLKVMATFMNSLNDADGTPISAGSTYKKPNLRVVSQAAIQSLDPKLVLRIIKLANTKREIGSKKEATHFSRSLKTAIRKYIKFREMNPQALEGVRKTGLANTYKNIYRYLHMNPSDEAAAILGWKQKDRQIDIRKEVFNFNGMTDLEIAEKIIAEKLPPTGVLGALKKKVSPVIARAVLETATGDQAVILRETFDKQGLLKDKETMSAFEKKVKTAKTALDRVDRISTEIDEDVQKVMKRARADKRKESWDSEIGAIYLHIDKSGSMHGAIDLAKECGAIIAECVNEPEKNFHWGMFDGNGYDLERKKPSEFVKDAFMVALYGMNDGGSTDCLANYKKAREYGCDVDIYITDQGHNCGSIEDKIRRIENRHPELSKPKCAVIVNVENSGNRRDTTLKDGLEAAGIPVSEIDPKALKESALVMQAIKTAMKGAIATIDSIMETPLLKLPKWWFSVDSSNGNK